MLISTPFRWRERLRPGAIHLGISLAVALLAAWLVFGLWYPYPYREISGGRELFSILISVDVVLGPLITFSIFNRDKPWRLLRIDLAIVALLQLAALGYGLWTVAVARPVYLVFEYDRFRVVHAIDLSPEALSQAPPGMEVLPLTGPTLLSLRAFKDSSERMAATLAALQGVELATRPDLWQPYASAVPEVLQAARPVGLLKARFPDRAAEVDRLLANAGHDSATVVYVPLIGRKSFWTVFLNASSAAVVTAMPLDSF